MKKSRIVLSLILVLLLVFVGSFVLTACGEKDGDNTQSDEQIDTPVTDASDSLPSNPNEDDNQKEELPGNAESSFSLVFELKADDTYEVIGYIGEPINVIIPSTYQGKAVTSIGSSAFAYCLSLKSLIIPNSINSIGYSSFWFCFNLENLTLGTSVESIGDEAFGFCYNIKSIIIPNSINYIGSDAFLGCIKLVEIYNLSSLNITVGDDNNGYVAYWALDIYTSHDIPSKLSTDSNGYIIYTSGEEKILVGYTGNDTELTLPIGISSINKFAFYNIVLTISELAMPSNITSIVIPNTVKIIGEEAFSYCTNLTSVTLGSALNKISRNAFSDCYKLVEVYNLSSLSISKGSPENGYVGYYAKDIYTSLDTTSKLSTDSNGYIIHNNGEEKTLVGYTGSETKLTLPSGIDSVYKYAFYANYTINSVIIPDSVKIIEEQAFRNCSNLTSIDMSNFVTSIGSFVFYDCRNLTSVVIPGSVTSIGKSAFNCCVSLTSVYYVGTASEWGSITVDYDGSHLNFVTRYYYSETEPVEEGNYWHYVDGVVTVW